MQSHIRRFVPAAAVWLARRLPVRVLRAANQYLHRTPVRRRVLNSVWRVVADQPVVIPRGPLAGWRFAAGGGQPGYLLGASEPDLQRALMKNIRVGDVVYDVGANVGFFALLASRLATSTGHIYAFEPIEPNARSLQRNLDLNGVRHADVVRAAVSDTSGEVCMSRGNNQATGHLADVGDDLIDVGATTIDAFVASGNRPPDIVKIDVEGAENLVLQGARDTLRTHRPVILCELHYPLSDPRGKDITTVLRETRYDEELLGLDGGTMPHLLAIPRQ